MLYYFLQHVSLSGDARKNVLRTERTGSRSTRPPLQTIVYGNIVGDGAQILGAENGF